MIVDCHTHLWECPGHLSDEFVAEANARSRGKPMDLRVPPERHWPAMRNVDKAIVFGIRAFHSGLSSPNEYIADYARAHPEKIIGFAAVDPTHDNVRETLEHALDDLKLCGVKLGPIYQNIDMGTWAPAYAASKTTLNAVTCLLAAALKDKRLAVNAVCPGWCRTEMGGPTAPRSVAEGAAGIVWLAADAPQDKTGLFWRDREVIPW